MMKFFAYLTRIHKWAALLVGLQILMWTMGGVVMSVAPIETVRSERLIAEPGLLPADLSIGIDPMGAAKAAGFSSLQSLTLESFAGEPVWRMRGADKVALLSATTGEFLLPLSLENARALALADYVGAGELVSLELVETGPIEVRGEGPLYCATFSSPKNYTVWIDPGEGRVIAHRSRLWRFYDFFWMLHIMDYEERENFNNPLLIFFALSSFLFVLTGIGLLVHRLVLRPRPGIFRRWWS